MEVGEKIYIESLLDDMEYKEWTKNTFSTYNSAFKPSFFKSEFMWRYRMGRSMSQTDIDLRNKRIDILLKTIK